MEPSSARGDDGLRLQGLCLILTRSSLPRSVPS